MEEREAGQGCMLAYVNMTQPVWCYLPTRTGTKQFNSTSYALCGLINHRCNSTMFSTPVEYSKVCGTVRGYQYSPILAYNTNNNLTIDDVYMLMVSLSHMVMLHVSISGHNTGGPYDITTDNLNYNCPCKTFVNLVLVSVVDVNGMQYLWLTHCGMDC